MKTTKIMSKLVCVSALMLPLALPVAAQAQDQSPVTWYGSPATQLTYVQETPAVLYDDCLQTNTEYSFNVTADVQLEGTYTVDFTTREADGYAVSFDLDNVQGSGPGSFSTNVTFRTPSTPTNEQDQFFVDLAGISRGPSQGGPADETSLYVGVPCLTDVQAQPTATPAPSATPARTGNPSEVVATFLYALPQGDNAADYSAYLSQALEQRVANGEQLSTLLGIQNYYLSFTLGNSDLDAAGRATLTATLNYDGSAPAAQATFTVVQENGAWQIDNIVSVPLAAPAPSTAPVADKTITFKLAVNGTPCQNATYWGLVAILQSDGFSYTQLTDGDADGVYTGTAPAFYEGARLIVQLEQGTGVGQSTPLPGGTPVPVPGAPSRVIANFGTQEQDGLKYLVLNDDFVAEASVNGCAAAPSATAKPSATVAPSATAKPSAAASATPAPSSAPSKLPDTGAADTMLGGLLAAGAALAASGGYLLHRRAR